jgi:Lysine-specific metallo-endopeptidase
VSTSDHAREPEPDRPSSPGPDSATAEPEPTRLGPFEPASLLRLQRSAGNAAVTAAIRPGALSTLSSKTVLTEGGPTARIQRCGRALQCPCGGRCGCNSEKPEAAERQQQRASVQRVASDFEIKGRSRRSASTPNSIFFDLNDSSIDPAEDTKLTAFSGTALSTVTLKGFASEEETGRAALVDARIAAVAARLGTLSPGTGAPTKTPDLTSAVGQLDYRNVRRVEILVAGAASSVPNCAAGADIACGPSPNAFDKGFDAATNTLLPAAISALSSPISATTKTALALFGGVAKAPQVKAGLQKVLAHFPNMTPAIPLNDATAAGHRCINDCEGDVLAYNQHAGTAARMTVGPKYLQLTDPIKQGLILIHEGSHGAPGLTTDDKAYEWQRLLRFLPPSAALQNADSFTRFVELVHDPTAAGAAVTDDASGLPAAKRAQALEALAWLEQWLVQGRLEVRSLYAAVNRATSAGAWAAGDGWQQGVMTKVAHRFGLTAPPAVPSADDKASVAGIFDRLAQLRFAVTGSGRTLVPGPSPSEWEFGPGAQITLSPGFLGLSKRGKVERLLVMVVEAAAFIESARETAYVDLIKDMSPGFGGP